MGLIFNKGCKSHHFEEKEKTPYFKTIPHDMGYRMSVLRKKKSECVHEGCDKKKEEWTEVTRTGLEVSEFERFLEDPDALIEEGERSLAHYLREEIDQEEYENLEELKEYLNNEYFE